MTDVDEAENKAGAAIDRIEPIYSSGKGWHCVGKRDALAAIRTLRQAAERDRDKLWCRALVNLRDTYQMERVTAEVNRLRSLAAKETRNG